MFAAGERLRQREGELDPHVLAALRLALAPPRAARETRAAEEVGEHILKMAQNVADARAIEVEAAGAEPRVTVAIVGRALVAIGQHRVGLGRFFELGFRIQIALVAIGVMLEGCLAVGLTNLVVAGLARHGQDLVVVTLFTHTVGSSTKLERPAK